MTAAPRPLEVTLFTRPGCHLCEDAKQIMSPLLDEFHAVLREVNIDNDPQLKALYGCDVPVVFIGSHKAAKHHLDPNQFRRQLAEASSR